MNPSVSCTPLERSLWVLFFGLLLAGMANAADRGVDGGSAGTLGEIRVVDAPIREGSAETGYRSETVRMTGPWGEEDAQDSPYSITVMPAALLENVSARNIDQITKIAPLVQPGQPHDVNNIAQMSIRGFEVARVYLDGVPNNSLGLGVFVEEMDRLEILSGLSGFLYGTSPVGGLVNYQSKRPTAANLRRVTVGNYGGSQYYAHADLGGMIGADRKWGYRINLLKQSGGTAIDHQKLGRQMVSGNFDWRPTDDLLVQFGLSSKKYRLDGRPFQFYLGGAVPAPLDGSKLYAPRDTFVDVDTDEASIGLTYRINETFTFRSAYQRKKDARSMVYAIGSLNNNQTQYQMDLYGSAHDILNEGGYAYLDSSFSLGQVRHKLTLGVNGYNYKGRSAVFSNGNMFFHAGPYTVDFSSPDAGGVTVPGWNLRDAYMSPNGRIRNVNAIIADAMQFNDQWSLKIGANRSEIRTESFDPLSGTAVPGTRYEKAATTPTVSVLYRPRDAVTAYATYIESLEAGAIVGNTYQNAGAILEPLSSRQHELGVKANVGALQLSGALFQIERASEYSDDGTFTGTYVQDGRQVHRGLEFSATGKPLKEWTIMAGLVLMDTKIRRSDNPLLVGKRPAWVSERTFKVYVEYAPASLAGWTFTGGTYFFGSSYQDAMNTQRVPGYRLLDLGLRYRTKIAGNDTDMRLNLMNATNERYWAATSPGLPRSLAFSASMDF